MTMQGQIRFGLDARRYNLTAISLHWAIALLILIQIGLGWYMNEVLPDHSAAQRGVETLHISVGLTTLLLILIRIVIRFVRPPPPLPAGLPPLEATLARASHALFYLLMLAMPLTGWALVSANGHPFHWWGLNWPQLPGANLLAGAQHRQQRHVLQAVHTNTLIWIVLANLVLHVAAVLKLQFEGHPVLWRMLPGAPGRGTFD